MTAIKLTPESLTYDCQKFYNAADEINRINNDIARLVSSLDWEVRSRGSVENMIDRAAADGSNLASGVESLAQYLKTAANLFQEADANGKTSIEDMTCKMTPAVATASGVTAASLFAGLFAGEKQWLATELGWLKNIMGVGNTVTTANSLSSQNIVQNAAADNSAESTTATDETQTNNSIDWPNNAAYQGPDNPYAKSGYGGQCTSFVWGRVKEKLGISLPFTKSAKYWWEDTKGLNFGSSPRANAIAVWAGDSTNPYGHVAFVEAVSGNNITFNEANVSTYNGSNFGGGYDGNPETLNITNFEHRGTGVGQLLGYIYLD